MATMQKTVLNAPLVARGGDDGSSGLGIKAKLVALTGVLVAVPAFVNAGYDIYAAVMKLPRTEAERLNAELFRKNFRKNPVVELPVPIKLSAGTVEVKFSIYEEGDVYVQYGTQTQWFSLPKSTATRNAAMPLIPSAFAQKTGVKPSIDSRYLWSDSKITSQNSSIAGNVVMRSQTFDNGVTENATIDIRSGKIIDLEREKGLPGAIPSDSSNAAPYVYKLAPIDVERLRRNK